MGQRCKCAHCLADYSAEFPSWHASCCLAAMPGLLFHCATLSRQVLDIPRTLEFLETHGVAVAAFGVDEFPAFFTPHSGCRAPSRADTPLEWVMKGRRACRGAVLLGMPPTCTVDPYMPCEWKLGWMVWIRKESIESASSPAKGWPA